MPRTMTLARSTSNDPKFAPDGIAYRALSDYRSTLAWNTLRGVCPSHVESFCAANLVQSCFVPLVDARCGTGGGGRAGDGAGERGGAGLSLIHI